jgi:hypothetical protein
VFEILHDAFIGRDRDALDPLLLAQYGSTMSSWGESRWLLWFQPGLPIPRDRRCFWFLLRKELELVTPRKSAFILHVGRDECPRPTWTQAESFLELDTSPWTLHSDEASRVDGIRRLSEVAGVILFHNFEGRLQRFVNRRKLDAYPLAGSPLEFG